MSLEVSNLEREKRNLAAAEGWRVREMEEGKEWSVKEKNETTTRPSLKSDVPFNKYELWKHKVPFYLITCFFSIHK